MHIHHDILPFLRVTESERNRIAGCSDDDAHWASEMAWTTPQYSKNKVNWAGELIIQPRQTYDYLPADQREAMEYEEIGRYFDALDIVNNWRSSHNFPLNTFHIGLRRRARAIDGGCITAQRIKRLSSIEAKLGRFPTMTLSQMQDIGGCRAIVGTCTHVKELAKSYGESDIKHALAQKDDYIECPKNSGYRGVHLIYRYFSDKRIDYNSLKIEVQLRSQLQHAWATAVETVGAFVQQALKSSIGEKDWLRFFALMGTAIAIRENTAPMPNTPTTYAQLVKELREYANTLDIANKLAAFGTALDITESPEVKNGHYFLIEVNHRAKIVGVTSFKQAESERATAEYLDVEKRLRTLRSLTPCWYQSIRWRRCAARTQITSWILRFSLI